jgi:signal transduction histidine kinase
MKFYYFVFVFFSLFFHGQQYASQWYGMDEGLPQNSIKDIIKDKYGFIWLSTDGGILRYDGKSFLLFNDFKIGSLSFKDFLGYGKDGEIICFNNGEKEGILISNRTVKVLPDPKLARTYSLTEKFQYKRFYKNSLINEFYPDVDYYYIKTNSGIYLFDNQQIEYKASNGSKKTVQQNFRHAFLKNAFEQNNVVYIGDPKNRRTMILRNGTLSYDNQPSLYNDPKTKIYWHQGTKQVFVINNDNIYISKVINGKPALTFLMRYKNIEELFLYCMFYDEESNKMYFGNVVKGLNIVNLSNFYVSQKNIPYSGEVCYEALPFTRNSVITKQGIEYFKDKTNELYSANPKYDKRYLVYDNSYNLLYVEFNKIHRRYKSTLYKKRDSIRFFGKSVEGLYKIGKNYVVNIPDYKWNYYLTVFPDDTFKKARNIFRFKENINFVTNYNNDLFYVGTSNGIYLLSLSKNKIVKYLAKDLPVKEIQQTRDGNFWFTTHNKGLYLLKNNEVIKMPEDKDGYMANAHHILEDRHGIFWISSNNGLFKVSKKMLLDYAQNKDSKVTYYRYTKENGFLNNEFNGSSNPSGNILENGEFVFPSMEGFVFFKPDEIKTYYPKSNQLFVERAKIGKENINFKDTLRIKSDYKNADIFIDIPYYYDVKNIYLEAKLENSGNNKWEEIKSDKKYSLSAVDPGNYTLLIRFLVGENGKFAYKRVYLEIKPFFYQTMLFKIFILLLIATAIVMIIQMRTNFLRIKNKKLKNNLYSTNQELKETSNNLEITKNKLKNEAEYQQKIMESISHDITTPVRFIALLSQKLSEAEDAKIQKKYFDGIYKTSEQLFKFTLGLKEYTELYKEENIFDEEEHSLYDLIEDKKLLFEEMASDNNTVIANLCDPQLKVKTNQNILSAIMHNLIDNAVKNTTDGRIVITTDFKNAQLEIGISDTGKGMSQSQIEYYSHVFESMETENFVFKNYGLGLHMVIQLSKKINAKISFHENTPKGTIVKIFLKID